VERVAISTLYFYLTHGLVRRASTLFVNSPLWWLLCHFLLSMWWDGAGAGEPG
jgi:hypothetical protein